MSRRWSSLNVRYLTAQDQRAKNYLWDNSILLKKNEFSEEESGPIIIALLLACFNYGNKLKENYVFLKKLPEEIERLLVY